MMKREAIVEDTQRYSTSTPSWLLFLETLSFVPEWFNEWSKPINDNEKKKKEKTTEMNFVRWSLVYEEKSRQNTGLHWRAAIQRTNQPLFPAVRKAIDNGSST